MNEAFVYDPHYEPPYAEAPKARSARPANLRAAAGLGEQCQMGPCHPNGTPAILTYLLRCAALRIEELEGPGDE